MIFSIDQNSHPLWDTPAKLQVLSRSGHKVRHFVEDIDVAFTSLGWHSDDEGTLHVAPERFHRSGGQDWGAALFYSEFLGRLPVDIRHWQPYTGMKTRVLARRLGRSVDDLYDELSPGDNWQLIGPSYVPRQPPSPVQDKTHPEISPQVGDRQYHRIIGDLSVAEIRPFLRKIMNIASRDVHQAFPSAQSRRRTDQWFARETARLEAMLDEYAGGRLVELYTRWLGQHVPADVQIDLASSLLKDFTVGPAAALLNAFLTGYDKLAGLYNDAIVESGAPLHLLDVAAGELPFFAVMTHQGRAVRTAVHLDGSSVRIGGRSFALQGDGRIDPAVLGGAGVHGIVPKAVLLVIQVRLAPAGGPLAVPYQGSSYMPAVHCLVRKLTDAGVLEGPIHPVLRVRLAMLDRMGRLDTPIRLPNHLAECFGKTEIPASQLGRHYGDIATDAAARLDAFGIEAGRLRWQQDNCPGLLSRIEELDARRRDLARDDPKGQAVRNVGKAAKAVQTQLLERMLRQIAADWQIRQIDYWDSRGAIEPWCVALGGETFYNEVLDTAEIYEETAAKDQT